jgi:hypothetical protein
VITVLAHEWLTEIAVHYHIGHNHRAVDRHTVSDFVLKPLLLGFGVEAEEFGVVLRDQRNAAGAGV